MDRAAATVIRMTTLTDSTRALTDPVGDLGGRWMLDPEVLGPCRDAGYPNGFAYYVTGRGGVLGNVDADIVASAFGFFHPALVRKMWEAGVGVEGAANAAHRYGDACAQFGRTRVAGFTGAARLAELAGAVAAGVDVSGLALFAGWRTQALPDDVEGRAAFLLHVLRELRGSVHLVAVLATGLGVRDAVLAHGGEAQAKQFGWPAPYAEVGPESPAAAETLTDTMLAALYGAVLADDEVAELAALVHALRAHVDKR